MFGEEILNEKQLAMKLGVSRSFVYKMLKKWSSLPSTRK